MQRYAKIALLGLSLLFITQAIWAQKTEFVSYKKTLLPVLKELPPEKQKDILAFTGHKLAAAGTKIEVTDLKVMKKQFKTLSPEAKQQVWKMTQMKAGLLEMATETNPPVPPAPAQPQAVQLKPQAGSMVQKPRTTPAQPPYIEEANSLPKTTIEWEADIHDFGEIKQGEVVEHTFVFTNTGDHPVKLTRVKPSCGCTAPDWSRAPIGPGEQGQIKVKFNSTGKMGPQVKTITVTYNGEPINKVLRFKGNIVLRQRPNDLDKL
ncbi:MAG: DUF1573 domain-containing protein [Bacteroidota bacterium]